MRSALPDNVGCHNVRDMALAVSSCRSRGLGGRRGVQRHLCVCAYRLEPDELPDKRSGQRVKVAGQTSRWLAGTGRQAGGRAVWQHATMNFAYVTGRV